jgi:hypothetical protein
MKLRTKKERWISGIFMFVLFILVVLETVFSFNLTSALSKFSDNTQGSSLASNYSAMVGWSIGLVAMLVVIIVVAIVGIIFTPYIIIVFLILFVILNITLFVYVSIVLNSVLKSSDYKNGTNNYRSALNAIIALMVLTVIVIVGTGAFLFYMIRSLYKSGGIESEGYYAKIFGDDDTYEQEEQKIFKSQLAQLQAIGPYVVSSSAPASSPAPTPSPAPAPMPVNDDKKQIKKAKKQVAKALNIEIQDVLEQSDPQGNINLVAKKGETVFTTPFKSKKQN